MKQNKTSVEIAKDVLENINKHVLSEYPEECCGFIFGICDNDKYLINKFMPIVNNQVLNRERRFSITPQQYMQGEDFADDNQLLFLGVYHSHPDHPSIPSETDLNWAMPNFLYPIISVSKGEINSMNWWQLRTDKREFQEITPFR